MKTLNNKKSIVKSPGNKPAKKIRNKSQSDTKFNIGFIEEKLLELFPKETACQWDKTGLLTGDKNAYVKKIAVSLDPTLTAIDIAQKHNCNLLITHHPAYLSNINGPFTNIPVNNITGNLIYNAISKNVALMNFHTALDVSKQGGQVLPKLLNLVENEVFVKTDIEKNLGFGRLCSFGEQDKSITLKTLSAKCTSIFGRSPKIWGDLSSKLKNVVTTTGSCGNFENPDDLLMQCVNKKIDCLICGEIKYHDAITAINLGLNILELGHDISELPLCGVLISCLQELGIDKKDIVYINQSTNWTYHKGKIV